MRNYTNTFAQLDSQLNKNVERDIGKNGRLGSIEESCREGEWKIYGFRSRGDYHFYRQDNQEEWSQLMNLDASGNKIKDILTVNRNYKDHRYEQLCGCYCVNK